ncbi:hypothetical protein M3Y98_01212500 [Aphelenchoides besseyi]|nr:hypothetical protein M3Y98_01212500 [Aphelenchoides besseyi]
MPTKQSIFCIVLTTVVVIAHCTSILQVDVFTSSVNNISHTEIHAKGNLLNWARTVEGSSLYSVQQNSNELNFRPTSVPYLQVLNLDSGKLNCYALNACYQTLNNAVLNVYDGYLTIRSSVYGCNLQCTTGLYALKKPGTLLGLTCFSCSPAVKTDLKYAALIRPFILPNRPIKTQKV